MLQNCTMLQSLLCPNYIHAMLIKLMILSVCYCVSLDESSRIYRSTCYLSYAATSGCWKNITFLMHMHICSKSQKDHTPSEDIIFPEYSFIFWPYYCIYRLSYTYPIHGRWFMPFQFRKGAAWTCPCDYLDVIFHKRSVCRSLYLTLKQEIIYWANFDLYLLC